MIEPRESERLDTEAATVPSPGRARMALKLIAFLAIGGILANALSAVIVRNQVLFKGLGIEQGAHHIYDALFASRRASVAPVVVVGDSVAGQILAEASPAAARVQNLTTYYTVSMIGQYLLVRNRLQHDPHPRKVALLYIPGSFSNDLDNELIYPHFVRPFLDSDTASVLTPRAAARLRKGNAWFAVYQLPIAKTLLWIPAADYLPKPGERASPDTGIVSVTSLEYLEKIRDACGERGVAFRVYSPPVCRCRLPDLRAMRERIEQAGMGTEFRDYFTTLSVLEESAFVADHVHLTREASPSSRGSKTGGGRKPPPRCLAPPPGDGRLVLRRGRCSAVWMGGRAFSSRCCRSDRSRSPPHR